MPEAVEIADVAVDTSVDDDDDCGFKVAEEEEEDKTQLARITPFNLAIDVPLDGPPPDD